MRPKSFHEQHRHLSPESALAVLEQDQPEREDVVVCHGDDCFPNIVIDGWQVSGFLDLARP